MHWSEALKTLQRDDSIVIESADKGSAVVIMDREMYIAEGIHQLNDRLFYLETPFDLTQKHNQMVTQLVTDMINRGEISEKTGNFLIIEKPQTPHFYMLPKIHKNKVPL